MLIMATSRKKLYFVVIFAVIFFGSEIGVRIIGLTDFPLYDANNIIGYIPKPSQSGIFLGKNAWKFNSLSMQNDEEFNATSAIDILLVGDSIVSGGNPYKKEDRLGRQLAKKLDGPVWSISAGSWGLRNELAYFGLHPNVIGEIDKIFIISNSEDFDRASSWACEYTHPRSQPIIASFYLFKRYIYWPGGSCGGTITPPPLLVPDRNWRIDLKNEISKDQYRNKQIIMFLYPKKGELHENKLEELEAEGKDVIDQSNETITVYSIGRDSRWKEEFYKDDIHPSTEGIVALASILAHPEQSTKLKKY